MFSSYKKIYKIRFVDTTDEIIWANFGDFVTSIFVKNSQKQKKIFFLIPPHLRRYTETVIAPFF